MGFLFVLDPLVSGLLQFWARSATDIVDGMMVALPDFAQGALDKVLVAGRPRGVRVQSL